MEIIDRLKNTIKGLEDTIDAATGAGALDTITTDRINNYRGIIEKQKDLILQMEVDLSNNQLEKVDKGLKLIEGLSIFIKEDAQSLCERLIADQSGYSTGVEDEYDC